MLTLFRQTPTHRTAALHFKDRLILYTAHPDQLRVIPLTDSGPTLLASIMQACPGQGRGLTTWLTHPQLAIRLLTFPFGSEEEVRAILTEQLQQEWPTDDPYVWGLYSLRQTPSETQLIAVGLPEPAWTTWLAQWQPLGLDPDSVQLLGVPAWHAWQQQADKPTGAHALLQLEPHGGMVIHGIATTLMGIYPLMPYPETPTEQSSWYRQVSRIIDEIRARHGDHATPSTLGICGSHLPEGLDHTLAEALALPVSSLFPLQTDKVWPPLVSLLTPVATGIEFRTGRHVSRATATAHRRRRVALGTTIGMLLLSGLGTLGWMGWDRIDAYDRLTAQTARLVQQLIPGQSPANPVEQAKTAITTLRAQLTGLQQTPWRATDGLATLTNGLPSSIALTIREMTITPTLVMIDGSVQSFAALDELRTALQALPQVTNITVANTASAQAQTVTFRLTIQIRPKESHS